MFKLPKLKGTASIGESQLIGMISEIVSYKNAAINTKNGAAEITLKENSGLATVIPVDFIMETVEACFQKRTAKAEATKTPPENSSLPK